MLSNNPTDSSCVACQSQKPETRPLKSTFVYDDKFKPSDDLWECSACMLRNETSMGKCVACGASKPSGGKKTSLSFAFDQASNMWECGTCMIRNDADKDACIACQATRGGDKLKTLPAIWECDTCLIRNKADVGKCIACETPRSTQTSSKGTIFHICIHVMHKPAVVPGNAQPLLCIIFF